MSVYTVKNVFWQKQQVGTEKNVQVRKAEKGGEEVIAEVLGRLFKDSLTSMQTLRPAAWIFNSFSICFSGLHRFFKMYINNYDVLGI